MPESTSTVVIAGATGLIGSALVPRLEARGHKVIRLVRREPRAGEHRWDPRAGRLDRSVIAGAHAVINLAGAGIGDHRWTDRYKRELLESRTATTALLARTIGELGDDRPSIFVSASAVGFYGDRGDERLDESSAVGSGFLADLCERWEAATRSASDAGTRVAMLRTGVVLAGQGGALGKQLLLFKLGLGATMGSGRQWLSWIAIDDHVAAVCHVLDHDISGPVNLTAPTPVTNREFTRTLASVLRRPHFLRVPAVAPRLALGREFADHLLFYSQRVEPRALTGAGFQFSHPTLEGALRAVLDRPAPVAS
jgi:uncharacterized protein (TIGR01777 family)